MRHRQTNCTVVCLVLLFECSCSPQNVASVQYGYNKAHFETILRSKKLQYFNRSWYKKKINAAIVCAAAGDGEVGE